MPTNKLESALEKWVKAAICFYIALALGGLVAFVALCANAEATPRYWGIDQLGGAKYPDTIAQAHPSGFAMGIFTQKELFGDGFKATDQVLNKRKDIPLVRYNLRWSDSHTFKRSDFPKIVAEAKRGVPVINKYPAVECEVSGATEHQLNARDAQDLASLVLAAIPERCKYINNPWEGKGAFIPTTSRIKNEIHGRSANKPKIGGKYNWSADGSDSFDIDITNLKNKFSDADVFFFWTSQNNGRKNSADTTPRPQRKAWPTKELIRALGFLATDQGTVNLPRKFLVKPKADQHEVPPEPRALKPVLIFPIKASEIVVKHQGKVVTKSGKGQPFADGRTRYYFGLYGYQIMQAAKTNIVELWAGSKRLGTANLGFRQGEFRN